ncbi:MFS transporter [Burkholderia ubonensis]|uniref:MFS transporter n=1 Tax=Burkholderia ubonensis TaxID=101571 RepID=A0AA40R2S1_9BURK|nr:MFS transporter [Burkholderia ubonensis]KVU27919.1 MFS transporter [Burkholderia ubonensis]KWZ52137.1 MFS transporter [Burkholderia ubonensis]
MRSRFDPILKIALTANLFEWYEFSLTAFMALEIGRLFFPPASDKLALALSFSLFASSYLARPFGSLFFGALGNRYGTGTALKFSMLGMATPASLIAFLPTYQAAGYLATILLLTLKVLQGFCAGGEMPLSGYFVSLNANDRNRGPYCAFVVVSGFIGMLLASGTTFGLPYLASALRPLTDGSTAGHWSESWRWPFLLCIPLSLAIYSLRSSVSKGLSAQERRTSRRKPALPLAQAFILVAFMEIVIYALLVWMPNYLHSYLGASSFDAHFSNVVTLIVFSASTIGAGYGARVTSAANLVLAGIVSLVLGSYPLFRVLQTGDPVLQLLAQAALAIMAGCIVGVIFVVLADLFKESWGDVGMASTYSFATAIFGGTAPVACAYLIEVTHLVTAPAIYILVTGLLAAPVAYSLASTQRGRMRFRVSD